MRTGSSLGTIIDMDDVGKSACGRNQPILDETLGNEKFTACVYAGPSRVALSAAPRKRGASPIDLYLVRTTWHPMIRSFADPRVESFFRDGICPARWQAFETIAKRKLDMLDALRSSATFATSIHRKP
jgi:hypothetical protein